MGRALGSDSITVVGHHLRRVLEIFRLAVEQFRLMATLTPQDFLAFRGKLGTASGFQSLQMREIEAIMGLQETEHAAFGHPDPLDAVRTMLQRLPDGAARLEQLQRTR